jgi:serine protease Do
MNNHRREFSPVLAGLMIGLSTTCFAMARDAKSPDATDDSDSLRATQTVVRDVAREMRKYLVRLETVGGTQPGRPIAEAEETEGETTKQARTQRPFVDTPGSNFEIADGPTTGIIFSADGYLIASSFNFVREPILISATMPDGRRLTAELIARDQVRKIALLKVDAENLPVPTWVMPADIRVGQRAIALGLGFGDERPSVTLGIVSALNRMRVGAIQTDAKLSPANYGGPVCDIDGRVLGIAVPMAQRPGELAGVEFYDSGIGFALPIERVDEIVAVLKSGRSFYRGWLGIQIDPKIQDGVVVFKVADPSPMQAAGVVPGDRIVAIDGEPIRHFGDMVRALYMTPAGEQVTLQLQSGGRDFNAVVTLAASHELGDLPDVAEPFDPSVPTPETDEDE